MEHQYLTQAHRRNSEAAIKHIVESKKSPFTLQEALKQQKRNSKDNSHMLKDKNGIVYVVDDIVSKSVF
ncbi:MAG: hypothetical protein LBI58_00965 [Tannerellaceae bacterium]|nr:hypothetical protein [Tannerellaceae bacterium]